MKRLVAVTGMATLVGCSSVGVHSKAKDPSDVAANEAELTALRAQVEEQSEELRILRGQLALARSQVQELRSEREAEAKHTVRASAGGQQLPWAKKPGILAAEETEREMLRLYGDERLPMTADVPELPEFVEEHPTDDSNLEGYRRGLSLVREQRFQEALTLFTDFLSTHPNHPYTDNALFWCGEIRFLRHDYGRALEDFERIEKQYPWGNKLPDALYRIGQIHLKRGDTARAQAYFEKVRKQFPDTAAARLALREDAS